MIKMIMIKDAASIVPMLEIWSGERVHSGIQKPRPPSLHRAAVVYC